MTDHELDELMCNVLLDSADDEPDADAPVFAPSARHSRTMRAMLADPQAWAGRRQQRRTRRKRWLQNAASVLLSLLLGTGTLLLTGTKARAAVSDTSYSHWWTETTDRFMYFYYSGEIPEEALPVIEVTDLPEGYAERERFDGREQLHVVYENQDGDWINLIYRYPSNGRFDFYATDHYNVSEVQINDGAGIFFEPLDGYIVTDNELVWVDDEHHIQFILSAPVSQEDMVRMAESVQWAQPAK